MARGPWQDGGNQTDDADQCCPNMAAAIRDPEVLAELPDGLMTDQWWKDRRAVGVP